jgi:hypothetical protein
MANNLNVSNGKLPAYTAKTTQDSNGSHIQHLRTDLEAAYDQEISEVGGYIYIGWATPGTSQSAELWRICRVDAETGTKKWADSSGLFEKRWDQRLTYTY